MSCCAPPLLPAAKMLTLSQVSLLVSKTQDSNNNSPTVLKMMSSRCSLAARALPRSIRVADGPKRCLFGTPSTVDTDRLLREDQDAVKARMARRWGWDLSRERPSPSSTWQWEPVRTHPYRPKTATPVPAILSPLPATPNAINTSSSSSSSGTSTLPASPASPCPSTPVIRRLPLPWSQDSDSDDSCCGDSDSDSSTSCGTSSRPVPVQTRITDFWRTRRCSTGEAIVKANPVVPTSTPSAWTCPSCPV